MRIIRTITAALALCLLALAGCQPFFYYMEGGDNPRKFDKPVIEAAMPPELFDSGVSRESSDLMAQWFSEASGRLQAIVLNPPGGTESSQAYAAAFAAQRINQIDRILWELKARTSGWVGQNLPAAAKAGIRLGTQQAIAAGVKPDKSAVAGNFTLIDRGTIEALARDTTGNLYKAIDSMGKRAKTVLRQTQQQGLAEKDINTILAGGVIEGKPRQAIAQLRDSLRAIHGDKVSVNGINFGVKYYAELVVRTKTREASVTARHERLQSLGLQLVSIVGRISNNPCSAFLGQVFSLDGKSDKYPPYSSLPEGGPPFHPNCTKSTRPFVEALASDAQLDMAKGIPDAQKLLGKSFTEAQRAYKDLQLHAQVKQQYATTAEKLFS